MKTKLTKRDVKFFIIGFIFLLIIQTFLGLNSVGKLILQGFADGYETSKTK
jgi:hypothetical protein